MPDLDLSLLPSSDIRTPEQEMLFVMHKRACIQKKLGVLILKKQVKVFAQHFQGKECFSQSSQTGCTTVHLI